MLKSKSKIAGVLVCSAIAFMSSASYAQDQGSLQPGYYIYLGMQPGRNAPKAFTLNSAGTVVWQDSNRLPDDKPLSFDSSPPPKSTGRKPGVNTLTNTQYEEYNYPIIKWKPKPVSSIPKAIAQLSTTYEVNELKFKITLFRPATTSETTKPYGAGQGIQETSSSIVIPNTVTVSLLDQNGFKLTDFIVNQQQWERIPGTSILEARDKINCDELNYRRARDYSVK